jgi:hypothetical protein
MTEDEAFDEARRILNYELTVEGGKKLLALEPFFEEHFGDLWEAFIAASPFEVIMAINNDHCDDKNLSD